MRSSASWWAVLGALLLGLVTFDAARRTRLGHTVLSYPVWPWLVRTELAIIFTLSLVDLFQDTITLL